MVDLGLQVGLGVHFHHERLGASGITVGSWLKVILKASGSERAGSVEMRSTCPSDKLAARSRVHHLAVIRELDRVTAGGCGLADN